jgi:hypothetical protein
MSELTDYLRGELRAMHGLYNRVTEDLDDRMMNNVPEGGHQSIAFCLWHYVRTEDNAIQFVIQRKPTVWIEGGWDAKLGLDSKSQGTGFRRCARAGSRAPPTSASTCSMSSRAQTCEGADARRSGTNNHR